MEGEREGDRRKPRKRVAFERDKKEEKEKCVREREKSENVDFFSNRRSTKSGKINKFLNFSLRLSFYSDYFFYNH